MVRATLFFLLVGCGYDIREAALIDPPEPLAAKTAVSYWNKRIGTNLSVAQTCEQAGCVTVEIGPCPRPGLFACANADADGPYIHLRPAAFEHNLALIYAHEIGHLLGFGHTEHSGIMCRVYECMSWDSSMLDTF